MRRWRVFFAVLAVILLVEVVWLFSLPNDPVEAAIRRVPMGADEKAVEAAIGWPPDRSQLVYVGDDGPERPVVAWNVGPDLLLVQFENGRSVNALISRSGPPSFWERLWSWLPW